MSPPASSWDHALFMTLIATMLIAGLLGGLVNHFLAQEEQPTARFFMGRSLWIGIAASFMVPLFLNMISSNLIDKIKQEGTLNPTNLLVFAGFCLIAAVSSRAFIRTISDRILEEAKGAKKEAEAAVKEVQKAKEETEKLSEKIPEVQKDIEAVLARATESAESPERAAAPSDTSLGNDEKKVLHAFTTRPQFVLRTVSGLIQDAGMDPTKMDETLLKLERNGLVGQRKGKTGGTRWYITQRGLAMIGRG